MPPPRIPDVSLMHWPSGKSPAFCSDFGGKTYVSLFTSLLESETFGVAVFSDAVLINAQTARRRAVPVGLPDSEPSPPIVLTKYSVPFLAVSYWPGSARAGQTVKPGEPSMFVFSTCVNESEPGSDRPEICVLPIA